MGTRCVLHFCHQGHREPEAKIYRHWDGHPETIAKDFASFLDEVERQCGPRENDNRFGEPSYLAAKFVVWQAGRYAKGAALNFSGVAPINGGEPSDIEFIHTVTCQATPWQEEKAIRPTLTSAEYQRGGR